MSFPPSGVARSIVSNHRLSFGAMILFVVGVAIVWLLLYQLNSWLFSEIHFTNFISWVFLPAAIRMLAVMVGGWAGVFGLFVGAVLTNINLLPYEPYNIFILAALSALGPIVAVSICTQWLKLPEDLSGLTRSQLLVYAVAGSLLNALPHNLYFYATGLSYDAWSGLVPMFVGDLAGTLIVLYLASASIRLFTKSARAQV